MKSLELTGAVTAIANALACRLTAEELTLLASVLVQLGDTLATIVTVQSAEENGQNCKEQAKKRRP